jgi:hypothetical protein
MPKTLKKPKKLRDWQRFPGTTNLPICQFATHCPKCKQEANRVHARRSKNKAKLKPVDLEMENAILEIELVDKEVELNEIWAEKLAYYQELDELLLQRDQLREMRDQLREFMNN